MAKLYRSRENNVTALDSKTQLTTLGSQTAPGALLVPGGMSFLRAAHVVAIDDGATVESGAYLVRLEGPGIARGNFVFSAGGSGSAVTTGAAGSKMAKRIPIGIKCIPGQEILVFAEMLGTDLGTATVGVTLEFSTEAGPEGEIKGEITVEGEMTAVDTLVRLTTQGSVAAPSRLTPPDATKIKRLVTSHGSDGAASGNAILLVRLGGDAIKGGEQTFVVGGIQSTAAQTGSDRATFNKEPYMLEDLDLEITPNETLDVSVEMVGTDVGDMTACVTVMFE